MDDLVTENIGYFRNREGGVGRVAWCNDILLEYMDDYQARRGQAVRQVRRGHAGRHLRLLREYKGGGERRTGVPAHGREWDTGGKDGRGRALDEYGVPHETVREEDEMIPYYKPDVYPVVCGAT